MKHLALLILPLLFSFNVHGAKCDNQPIKGGYGLVDKTYQERCLKNYNESTDLFDGYKSFHINENILKAISKKFITNTVLHSIGKSHRGKDIWALQVGEDPRSRRAYDLPKTFINCAHHANEIMSTEYCYEIMDYLLKGEGRKYLSKFDFWIVPIVNPDGSENFWHKNRASGRKNGRPSGNPGWKRTDGVDINRNYPFKWGITSRTTSANPTSVYYMGPSAGSEPEIKAVMELSKREQFILSLTFHTAATKVLTPYTIPEAVNPTPDLARPFANAIAQTARTTRSDKPRYIVAKNLYPVSGTDQDWHYFQNGTIALLVEGPYFHTRITYKKSRSVMKNFIPGFEAYLDKFLAAPHAKVITKDKNGKPVSSQVTILDYKYEEGETFFTRQGSGDRWFLFPKAGKYTIEVKSQNNTYKETINIDDGAQEITLSP